LTDEPLLATTARFKAGHSLSFADALIAACAFGHKATLL
jgi:predicted nucleic acid-binding protein